MNHSKEEKARGRRKDGQITLAEHLVSPSKQLSHLILSTTLNGLYYHPYFTGKDAGTCWQHRPQVPRVTEPKIGTKSEYPNWGSQANLGWDLLD